MGLPLSTPPQYTLKADGDFQAKGRFHRITWAMSPATIQHVALYPISLSTLSWSEVHKSRPYYNVPSPRCSSIYTFATCPIRIANQHVIPVYQAVFDCVCSMLRPVGVDWLQLAQIGGWLHRSRCWRKHQGFCRSKVFIWSRKGHVAELCSTLATRRGMDRRCIIRDYARYT